MNITRNTTIATIATVAATAFAGVGAGAAQADTMSLSAGKPRPVVKWTHEDWKKCWSITYAQWREDGASIQNSATAADWTCGKPPV